MFKSNNNVHHNKILGDDILKYKKNSMAANFALLGIVFNCLYFTLLYGVNNSYLYKLIIGISVICTLAVLLAGFLASEEVKGYNKTYSIVLIVLAVVQIVRIFIIPLSALQNDALGTYYFFTWRSSSTTFAWLTIWLVLSAACFAFSAVWGYLVAVKLEKHVKAVEAGEIDIDAVLNEEDKLAEAASTESVQEVQ